MRFPPRLPLTAGVGSSLEPNMLLSLAWSAAICFRIERASSILLIGCSQNDLDVGIERTCKALLLRDQSLF